MKQFMDKDFLLSTDMAKTLYHDFAENVPILDYHCHINPQEIAEDRKFENITQVWLGGDHYKWRQMRSNGVEEKYITGDASDREKFQKWAETMPKLIGNPLYHWSHLELKKYFGYDGYLNGDTAEEVWNLCNAKLQDDSMTVRNIIKQSNVTLICTTDDPIDTLEWHKKNAADDTFDVQVLPAWRPDKATNIEKPDFAEYIGKLASVSGVEVKDFASLKEAIKNRMAYFAENGCCQGWTNTGNGCELIVEVREQTGNLSVNGTDLRFHKTDLFNVLSNEQSDGVGSQQDAEGVTGSVFNLLCFL